MRANWICENRIEGQGTEDKGKGQGTRDEGDDFEKDRINPWKVERG